jgi:hypothetical protein
MALEVEACYGDFGGAPFEEVSPQIVFVLRRPAAPVNRRRR